jgi:hypothetical protein
MGPKTRTEWTHTSHDSPLFFGLRDRQPEFSAHPIIETFLKNSLSAKFFDMF